jgi:hypothetical protein
MENVGQSFWSSFVISDATVKTEFASNQLISQELKFTLSSRRHEAHKELRARDRYLVSGAISNRLQAPAPIAAAQIGIVPDK